MGTKGRVVALSVAALLASTALTNGVDARPERDKHPIGFTTTSLVPGSDNGTESSLAIPAEGVAGDRFLSWQNPGEVNLSADGIHWGDSVTPDDNAGGDVTNAIDAAGTYYLAQFCGLPDPSGLHNCLYRSYDGGHTWPADKETYLIDNHPGAADRPWIDVYPRGLTTATATDTSATRVYLLYHTFSPDDQVYVTVSSDGGDTFGPPNPIAVGGTSTFDSECNTVPSGITVDQHDGTIYALWLSGNDIADNHVTGCNYSQIGPFNKAWVSVSKDGGATWTANLAWQGFFNPVTKIGDNANKIFGAISVDQSGQVHVVLPVRRNDDPVGFVATCARGLPICAENPAPTDLLLVTSPDTGAHWTQPVAINGVKADDHSYFYPSIAAGSAGVIDTLWYRALSDSPNNPDIDWSVGVSQVRNAVATYDSGPFAAYISAPVVSPEMLLEAGSVHHGGICTFGIFCSVTGGNRRLADANIVVLDPAGGANASWTADTNADGTTTRRIGFACQSSGPSAYADRPPLKGCYRSP